MRHAINLSLLLTLVGCFDFSATPFGTKGLRCDVGSVCEAGLVCDASDHCVDPCEGVRCSGRGACTYDPTAGASCVCDSGFVPTGNDCLEIGSLGAPCGPSASCGLGLTCANAVCVDACSLVDCDGHGTCGLVGAAVQCVCDPGYHSAGARCLDDCVGVTCGGHGSCSLTNDTAACTCTSGYSPSGLTCVQDSCVPDGNTTLVCEGGHILDVDSCDRRLGTHTNCGLRGCTGTTCNAVKWVGFGPSMPGEWTVYQTLGSTPAGVSRTGNVFGNAVGIDSTGAPVLAWTMTQGTDRVRFRRWSGSAWVGPDFGTGTDIVMAETGAGSGATLAMSTLDRPTVAWEAYRTVDQGHEVYLKSWTGSAWLELGGSATAGGVSNGSGAWATAPSVALLPSGDPFVAWEDNGSGSYLIRVSRWTGVGWGGTAQVSPTGVNSHNAIAAVDTDGHPLVAFTAAGDLTVMREDTSWSRLGTGFTTLAGYVSLAVCGTTGIAVAWSESNEIKARTWTGGAWVELGGPGGVSQTAAASIAPAIACGADGTPFIAWQEGNPSQIYVRTWNGTSWAEFPAGSATGGGVSNMTGGPQRASIAASNDRVCVSWEATNTVREAFLRCATR